MVQRDRLTKQSFDRNYLRIRKVVARFAHQHGITISEAARQVWKTDNAKVRANRTKRGKAIYWTLKRAYIWDILDVIERFDDKPASAYHSFAHQQCKTLRQYRDLQAKNLETNNKPATKLSNNQPLQTQAVLAVAIRPCEGNQKDTYMVYSHTCALPVPVVTTTANHTDPRTIMQAVLFGLSKLNQEMREPLNQIGKSYQWP